jgi:hypothetical protein
MRAKIFDPTLMQSVAIFCLACGIRIATVTVRDEDLEFLNGREFICRNCEEVER